MQPFSYTKVADVDAAISALAADPRATVVAGATELANWMKDGISAPSTLIDINALPLTGIEARPDGLRIGALARNADVARDGAVRAGYPVVAEALEKGASAQIRNMATVGGNLLQRTRCPYFRETSFPCNKRLPGSGCAARTGPHRGHAILGGSEACIATHPGDLPVALVALDAIVHLQGPAGPRSVPLDDFYLLPGETPERENVLQHSELIVAVEVPAGPYAARSRYLKVRDRESYEFALVSVAACLELDGSTVRSARVALGGVGTKPWRARSAEAVLAGHPLDADTLAAAGSAAVEGARPLHDNTFKVTLAARAVARALELAAYEPFGRAGNGGSVSGTAAAWADGSQDMRQDGGAA
jgi:xanthine dehydrogenase YagS FAD-binding subunit